MKKIVNIIRPYLWDLFVNGFLASYIIHYRVRIFWLKVLGAAIGKSSAIHGKCYISGNNLKIGDESYINKECIIDAAHGNIIIGNRVGIAYRCSLLTTQHDYRNLEKRTGCVTGADVIIGDGCWIGAGVTILPGVELERGVVIAAGSVVKHDCEENCIYAGNPAHLIRHI